MDAHTDSLTLVRAWKNQGGKSLNLTSVLTAISDLSLCHNIGLTLCHVPSKENLADTPSRVLSEADCMLAHPLWHHLEHHWGPRTIDLMSLDSNAQLGPDGKALRHFSPWLTPNSAGVNLFTQSLQPDDNAYVFPPVTFSLVLKVVVRNRIRKLNNLDL